MATEIISSKCSPLLKGARLLASLIIAGLIFLPVLHGSWKLRLVCLLLLLPAVPPAIIYLIMNPTRIKMPDSWNKYSTVPKDPRLIKRICGIGILTTALLFYAVIVLPLEWSGFKTLREGTANQITGKVTDNNTTLGAWFLAQDVSLDGDSDSYDYFLSGSPVRVGKRYVFWTLPGYHIILEHRAEKSDNSENGRP